ncbi:hypothetical protein EPO17_02435, partial [Patescibacteria group bacterium]
MEKKKIVKKEEEKAKEPVAKATVAAPAVVASKKRVESGILFVQSTYNNTKLLLADAKGNALCWSSSGSLG